MSYILLLIGLSFAGPADEGIFLALRVFLFVSDFAFVCVFVSC